MKRNEIESYFMASQQAKDDLAGKITTAKKERQRMHKSIQSQRDFLDKKKEECSGASGKRRQALEKETKQVIRPSILLCWLTTARPGESCFAELIRLT